MRPHITAFPMKGTAVLDFFCYGMIHLCIFFYLFYLFLHFISKLCFGLLISKVGNTQSTRWFKNKKYFLARFECCKEAGPWIANHFPAHQLGQEYFVTFFLKLISGCFQGELFESPSFCPWNHWGTDVEYKKMSRCLQEVPQGSNSHAENMYPRGKVSRDVDLSENN